MATTKTERAGVGFAVARRDGVVIEVRPHHDTIACFRGVQVSFELLNGTTPEQAKKILDVLKENVIGVMATTTSQGEEPVKDDKAAAASS